VVGASSIVDRGSDASRVTVPLFSLVQMEVPTYHAESCPLCAKGLAVVKPGSRAS